LLECLLQNGVRWGHKPPGNPCFVRPIQHHWCGGGAAYLQGQGCLMHPPRANSFYFQDQSECESTGLQKERAQIVNFTSS
jgi:hypothetical protein